MSSLLTELVMVVKQESESLEKLMETTIMTASLEVRHGGEFLHNNRKPIDVLIYY